MKAKLKVIIRITLISLAALILGLNVYTLNASRLAGNPMPMPFGIGAATVLSGSMEPELSVGDFLIVVERDEYEVGDVIVYQNGRSAITHRIVEINGDEIITRGDANNVDDEPINAEQIKGEVVLAIPWLGYLVNIIKTPIGTLCLLALSVFLLERSFHTEKKGDEDELAAIRAEIERLKKEQKR